MDIDVASAISGSPLDSEAAFAALVADHHRDLVRLAYAIVGDPDVANDVAQAAWTAAWRNRSRIREPENVLRGWGQYFGIGNAAQHFAAVDSYVYCRFVLFDRAKHQRRSRHAPGLGQTLVAAGLHRLSRTVRYLATVHAPR
ncbi:MAG: hypothetical protein M3509_08355 [Chloroflexota bacterium]|nr:hypothetical protein [Chloroflexota bacterium]